MKGKIKKAVKTDGVIFEIDVYENVKNGVVFFTESCVVCGKDTGVDIRTPAYQRHFYSYDAGQTCGCVDVRY